MNVVCGPRDEGFPTVLMSAATGCKLAKLGWNKIEHQNTFFQYFFHFYPIYGIHWTLKMPYVFEHLEVYMKTLFLYYLVKKWFHTILYHFNTLEQIAMNFESHNPKIQIFIKENLFKMPLTIYVGHIISASMPKFSWIHWGGDKTTDILQMKFYWNSLWGVRLTASHHQFK